MEKVYIDLRVQKVMVFLISLDYQGSDGLDGVESLITNVGGRLLMLQKDKANPERKTRKVLYTVVKYTGSVL